MQVMEHKLEVPNDTRHDIERNVAIRTYARVKLHRVDHGAATFKII